MFQNKISNIFLVFCFAFLFGILVNFLTGNYVITYSISESFTKAEAKALVGKRVIDKCFNDRSEGTITHYQQDGFAGPIGVYIHYDKSIKGKFNDIGYDLEPFRKCIELIEKAN